MSYGCTVLLETPAAQLSDVKDCIAKLGSTTDEGTSILSLRLSVIPARNVGYFAESAPCWIELDASSGDSLIHPVGVFLAQHLSVVFATTAVLMLNGIELFGVEFVRGTLRRNEMDVASAAVTAGTFSRWQRA